MQHDCPSGHVTSTLGMPIANHNEAPVTLGRLLKIFNSDIKHGKRKRVAVMVTLENATLHLDVNLDSKPGNCLLV